jgi:RNA polymerase sigma factor (sigma-70 family)
MPRSENALDYWMNQAGRHPVLSKAEVIELSRRIREADSEKKRIKLVNKLCVHNLKLVIKVVKMYVRRQNGLSWADGRTEDLMQQGYLGLRRAAEKFDETKGYTFATYAYAWINQSLGRYYLEDSIIRVPEHMRRELHYFLVNGHARKGHETVVERWGEAAGRAISTASINEMCKHHGEPDEKINVLPIESSVFHQPEHHYERRLDLEYEIKKAGVNEEETNLILCYIMHGSLDKACQAAKLPRSRYTMSKVNKLIEQVKQSAKSAKLN